MNPKRSHISALLVIDVQQGLFERSAPIYQSEQVLANINALVDQAHRQEVPVVYIQHANDNTLKRESREWQFHAEIQPQKDDLHIHKQHGNAFEDTGLHQQLQDQQISKIIVTGLVTHGCVRATCLGGLELGYEVVLARDAHSNFSKDAVQIIEEWHGKLEQAGAQLKATEKISF